MVFLGNVKIKMKREKSSYVNFKNSLAGDQLRVPDSR